MSEGKQKQKNGVCQEAGGTKQLSYVFQSPDCSFSLQAIVYPS